MDKNDFVGVNSEEQMGTEVGGCEKRSNHLAWKVAGAVAVVLLTAGVITQLADIRRYIRISTM
jgi:hypothetical protein